MRDLPPTVVEAYLKVIKGFIDRDAGTDIVMAASIGYWAGTAAAATDSLDYLDKKNLEEAIDHIYAISRASTNTLEKALLDYNEQVGVDDAERH